MLKNIGSNWVLTAVTIGAAYVLMPLLIRLLGEDGYGTWTLISSVTGYLALLVLGVPMASVRYFAEHVADGDRRQLNTAIGSCMGLYLLLGVAALVVGTGLFALFDLTYDIPAAWRSEARLAFGLMILHIAAGFVGQIPFAIMAAYQDFVRRNLVLVGTVLLRLGLTLSLLVLTRKLVFLAAIQVICLVFEMSVSWFIVRHRYPGVRLSFADFDRRVLRRIFSFSLYVLLLNVGIRLSFQTDALVIGAFLDIDQISFFAIASSLAVYLMEFVVAIAAVVMPMATTLKSQGRMGELRHLFLVWSKVAFSLTLMAGLFLIVLGPRFIGWWIHPSFEGPSGGVLKILTVSCLVFLPVRGVALPILMGLGKPALPTIGFLVASVVNLGLSVLLVRPFGLNGVALGTAIPNVLFAIALVVLTCQELKTPLVEWVRYVIPRAVLATIPVFLVLLWFKLDVDVQGLPGLVVAGLVTSLLFALEWVLFVYRDDPYVDLGRRLARLRSWSRP